MSKSIDPMLISDRRRNPLGSVAGVIVSMSLRPAIPWQDALQQRLPPLYQPVLFSTDRLNL